MESRDAIEFLLVLVQPNDGAGALGMLRADGAEIHDEGNTGVGDSGGVGIGDAVLVGAQIRMGEIFGEDEVDGGSASEGFGDGVGIFDVSDEGLGAEIGERSELLWVTGNGANLFAFGEQHLGCDASRAAGGAGDDDHGGLLW